MQKADEKGILFLQPLSTCNMPFTAQKSYRVFARVALTSDQKPYLTTDSCSGTHEIKP